MLPTRLFRFYNKSVHQWPYVTQSLQTALLMTVGDIISQLIAEKKYYSQMNFNRSIKFGSTGLVIGPILCKWYHILDKVNNGSLKLTFIKKIALDQLIFAPFAIAFITIFIAFIDGKTKNEIEIKLKRDYVDILCTNYKVWPIIQCINFSMVPLHHRVLVTQSIAVVWNAYLSWKINSNKT
ncbi:hypothetical protein PGB90_005229 [Kerria lacca]